MGIRESLLNTITSVSNSDFVRIVTSAGVSSKATLANVIKSFETGLGAKSSLTTSDYVRVVGSDNVLYKQSIESISETIDSYNNAAILLTDCNDATDPSKLYYANGSTANRPDNSAWWFIKCEARSGNMLFQTAYWMNSTTIAAYERSRDTNGTWGSWTKMPTRTEVDALTSRFGDINNLITNFNDEAFIKSKYSRQTSMIILPFATAATNQPVGASYGFCIVYFGGDKNTFDLHYFNANGATAFRKYDGNGWHTWIINPSRAEVDALNSAVKKVTVRSSSPANVPCAGNPNYASFVIVGFAQGVGSVVLAIKVGAGAIQKVRDLTTNTDFTSSYLTFSYSNGYLTISSTSSDLSYFTVTCG